MQLSTNTVTEISITDFDKFDVINVVLKNSGEGKGRITIHCAGDTWSSYWPAMGKRTIEQFFIACDNDYLAKNLSDCPRHIIAELDVIKEQVLADIAKHDDFNQAEKSELSRLVDDIYVDQSQCNDAARKLFSQVYGDDWGYSLPEIDNPDYLYLCRVISAVKSALKQHEAAEQSEQFAKTFNTEKGQILCLIQPADFGEPEVRVFAQPEGLAVSSTALKFTDSDQGWEQAQKLFDNMDSEKAIQLCKPLFDFMGGAE